MSVAVLEQKMPKEQAMQKAQNKGDWFWNLVFHHKPLSELKLLYVEYILFDIETTSTPSLLGKLKSGTPQIPTTKKVQVLVNGSTGGVALVTEQLKIIEKDFHDKSEYQNTQFSDEEVTVRAKKLVHKITHRMMGGLHESKIVSRLSVYRPFWVAFYGEMQMGNKVRYIVIPADGGQNIRTR
jgi:hypothetical protein